VKPKPVLLLATCVALLNSRPSIGDAQILMNNFEMTSNRVSFQISGSFPTNSPGESRGALFFVNPNAAALPGFALGNSIGSTSNNFRRSQLLQTDWNPVGIRGEMYGDYFYVTFLNSFLPEEIIVGRLTAEWDGLTAFAPDRVTSLNVFWGSDPLLPINPSIQQPSRITGGTFLTTVTVPEPSTYALLLVTAAGALWWARLRRSVAPRGGHN